MKFIFFKFLEMLEVTVGWDSWEMIKFAPSPVKMDEDLTYMRLAYYASRTGDSFKVE